MMVIQVTHEDNKYSADLDQPIDISLPIKNGDDNPNCFWAAPVEISTIIVGDFVGSVARGGSTNYQRLSMTPHGNGTHTECYGHISADPNATIDQCLDKYHFVASLISVELTTLDNGDQIVTFEDFMAQMTLEKVEAVIIRTLPNDPAKKTQKYSGHNPPYLDAKITQYFADKNIEHLLVDLPSVDRESDEGRLTAHKNFWQTAGKIRASATITELVYIEEIILDGLYLLNIQIPSIVLDAVPSKPVIYPLQSIL
jgi:kynurenine formamidase